MHVFEGIHQDNAFEKHGEHTRLSKVQTPGRGGRTSLCLELLRKGPSINYATRDGWVTKSSSKTERDAGSKYNENDQKVT